MGARQSSPVGGVGGGGVTGGGGGLTATTPTTSTSSTSRNSDSGLIDSGTNTTGFAGLLSTSLCQNSSTSTRTRPIASNYDGIKCPICSKSMLPDDVEFHLVMCLTKPRISYNEDILTEDKGECVICLDDLSQGDIIARLPCLCIYHKCCIDAWFQVNRSCPEHPSD
ncbi:E3 ubiquitin-protein ligase ZNRF1-like [Panonychus citri]|uniref:E3 ubiquitin-protein ligase ZNRF1-like n=1 Tax=Panonychus citri TaxID=50023 RepID=UPI0023070D5A|nr:E3 ubiquitin-protein ligase ZNRF1-like [Panonychus citri]